MKKRNVKTEVLILALTAYFLLGAYGIAAARTEAPKEMVHAIMVREYGMPKTPDMWQYTVKSEAGTVLQYFEVFPLQAHIVEQSGKRLLYLLVTGNAVDRNGDSVDIHSTPEGNIRGLRYFVYDVTGPGQPQLLAKGPEVRDGAVVGHHGNPIFIFDSFSFVRIGADLWGWGGVSGKNIDDGYVGFTGNFDLIAFKDNKFVNLSRLPSVFMSRRDAVYLEINTAVGEGDATQEYFPLVTEIILHDDADEILYRDKQTTSIKRDGDELYYPNTLHDWPVYFEMVKNK